MESKFWKACKNQDLWIALDESIQRHKINWQWVKGHAGHRENEICDELAKKGHKIRHWKILATWKNNIEGGILFYSPIPKNIYR